MNRNFVDSIKLPESLHIPFFGGVYYDFITRWENAIVAKADIPRHPLNTQPRTERVIASLTSYPARIPFVHLAVKSLMLQTYKPDRILLWLADEQFPGRQLPASLLALERYGLEISWMHDLYGHKKYYYPVKEQKPEEVVITFDDDLLYSPRAIERLIKTHQRYPDCLVCERGQVFEDKSQPNPGRWKTISSIGVKEPTFSMNPSPGGGCLIPYHGFHPDALDESLIRELAYKNDDLWYMFMCAQNGTRMVKTRKYHRLFSPIAGSQVEQMATDNVTGNVNVQVMEKLKAHYPVAWQRILTDEM